MIEKLTNEYFDLFSNKNIDGLSNLFDDNIELKDWDVDAKNKENVLNSIKNIFNSVESIKTIPIKYYQDDLTICCDIYIEINNKEKINVMDVITFNNLGKIKKIKAFKI